MPNRLRFEIFNLLDQIDQAPDSISPEAFNYLALPLCGIQLSTQQIWFCNKRFKDQTYLNPSEIPQLPFKLSQLFEKPIVCEDGYIDMEMVQRRKGCLADCRIYGKSFRLQPDLAYIFSFTVSNLALNEHILAERASSFAKNPLMVPSWLVETAIQVRTNLATMSLVTEAFKAATQPLLKLSL